MIDKSGVGTPITMSMSLILSGTLATLVARHSVGVIRSGPAITIRLPLGKWSFAEVMAVYNAYDMAEFDVLSYLNKWHRAPVDSEIASQNLARIKERTPDAYYEIGDGGLHPKRGFGAVEDAIPHDY